MSPGDLVLWGLFVYSCPSHFTHEITFDALNSDEHEHVQKAPSLYFIQRLSLVSYKMLSKFSFLSWAPSRIKYTVALEHASCLCTLANISQGEVCMKHGRLFKKIKTRLKHQVFRSAQWEGKAGRGKRKQLINRLLLLWTAGFEAVLQPSIFTYNISEHILACFKVKWKKGSERWSDFLLIKFFYHVFLSVRDSRGWSLCL